MDFFGKLAAIYGWLNLISKLMHIYNCDKSGVTIIVKPKWWQNWVREMCRLFQQWKGGKPTWYYIMCVSIRIHVTSYGGLSS